MNTSPRRHAGVECSPPSPLTSARRREGARRTAGRHRQRTRAEDGLRLLAEVSTLLATSLDYDSTLGKVARLAVPLLADWCIVHLVEQDGSIRWLATAHGDPAKAELARELQRRYPRDPDGIDGVPGVLRTGRSVRYSQVSDAQLVARARDADHLRLLRAMASRSAMIVPLVARGRTLGVLSFLSARPNRRYGRADLRLAEELARRAALAVDNARLYHEAQDALRVRNEVLSVITHDLMQPLASVKACAELLQDDAAAGDDEQAAWLVGRIDAAATRMTAMLADLLDVARRQSGELPSLRRQTTDLVVLVRHQVDTYRKMTANHCIQLESAVPELFGKWDVVRMERVVSNLLSNALKYSPAGGDITVALALERDGADERACLSVRDEGIGIPAADLPYIFERFQRGANAVGRVAGTGIGLAAAKQIVEQHGGAIAVDSREGAGTTVSVRLPLG